MCECGTPFGNVAVRVHASTPRSAFAHRYLYLGGNPQLTGTIPNGIGALTKLQEFSLGWSSMSGTIPTSLIAMRNLGYASCCVLLVRRGSMLFTVACRCSRTLLPPLVTRCRLVELAQNYFTGTTIAFMSAMTQLTYGACA